MLSDGFSLCLCLSLSLSLSVSVSLCLSLSLSLSLSVSVSLSLSLSCAYVHRSWEATDLISKAASSLFFQITIAVKFVSLHKGVSKKSFVADVLFCSFVWFVVPTLLLIFLSTPCLLPSRRPYSSSETLSFWLRLPAWTTGMLNILTLSQRVCSHVSHLGKKSFQ